MVEIFTYGLEFGLMRLLELCDFLCQGPIFIDKFTLDPLMELLRSLAIFLESLNLIEELLVD
jgi:hypothetical protein